MKVLHICNGFCESKVHSELIRALDKEGLVQTVYSPVRAKSLVNKNVFNADNTRFVSIHNILPYHRYVYHLKGAALYRDLKSYCSPFDYDLSHASTLFSDGLLAYKLFREKGIPYIVAVRSSDVDVFMKFLPHAWPSGRKILLSARKIIFISPSLREKFCSSSVFRSILPEIKEKFFIQTNGIDSEWITNVTGTNPSPRTEILYAGSFLPRKKIPLLEAAFYELRSEIPGIHLTLVGGGGSDQEKVLDFAKNHADCVRYLGRITDRKKLITVFREHSIFAMPSVNETFGLVYFEALSQNMAVLYVRGEGVDGLLPREAGEAITMVTKKEIKEKLRKLVLNRSEYSNQSMDFNCLRWDRIADNYFALYESCN